MPKANGVRYEKFCGNETATEVIERLARAKIIARVESSLGETAFFYVVASKEVNKGTLLKIAKKLEGR